MIATNRAEDGKIEYAMVHVAPSEPASGNGYAGAHPPEGRSRRHDRYHVEHGDILRSGRQGPRCNAAEWHDYHRSVSLSCRGATDAHPSTGPDTHTRTGTADAHHTTTDALAQRGPELRTRHRLSHRQTRRDRLLYRACLRDTPRRHRQVQQLEQSRQHPRREPADDPLLALVPHPARPRRRTAVPTGAVTSTFFRQDLPDFQDGKALDPVDLVNPLSSSLLALKCSEQLHTDVSLLLNQRTVLIEPRLDQRPVVPQQHFRIDEPHVIVACRQSRHFPVHVSRILLVAPIHRPPIGIRRFRPGSSGRSA